jgi:hypothetical protein
VFVCSGVGGCPFGVFAVWGGRLFCWRVFVAEYDVALLPCVCRQCELERIQAVRMKGEVRGLALCVCWSTCPVYMVQRYCVPFGANVHARISASRGL